MPENLSQFGDSVQASPGWPWRIFLFSLLLLGGAVVFYLGLLLGYRPFLNSQIAKKDAEIVALAQSIPEAEQQALIKFYSQLGNLQTLLGQHVAGSKLLPLLEKSANKQVYYSSMNLNIDTRELILEGAALSYGVFAQQIEAFKRLPEVERLIINFADTRANVVNFNLVLVIKKGILQ